MRALLDAGEAGVLLMRMTEPETKRSFWVTPGGGIEDGENERAALQRELREETGYPGGIEGPLVWTRDFTFAWSGEIYRQLEHFYWLRCPVFDARPTQLTGGLEADSFTGLRWWTPDEIAASEESFAPLDLADRLRVLHAEGAPESPVVVGA